MVVKSTREQARLGRRLRSFGEARDHEIVVEGDDIGAAEALHHRKAGSIGIRDRMGGKLLNPGARSLVMCGGREFDSNPRANFDPVQSSGRCESDHE